MAEVAQEAIEMYEFCLEVADACGDLLTPIEKANVALQHLADTQDMRLDIPQMKESYIQAFLKAIAAKS